MHEELHLYRKYINEIDKIAGFPKDTNENIDNQALSFLLNPDYQWITIFEKGKKIGFLIIGIDEHHPSCDYFIAQAYILPEYRNQGRMTQTFKEFEKTHSGKYSYFVIHNNHIAIKFWENLFEALGYEKFNIPELKGTFDKEVCAQVAYEPKLDVLEE